MNYKIGGFDKMSDVSIATYPQEQKNKVKNTFPIIQRYDVMEAILSVDINEHERSKLSNIYSEILNMERIDLKYIDKITVSSNDDSEVYDILSKWKTHKRCKAKVLT